MKTITSNFLAENRYWPAGAPKQEFYLYLELKGSQAPADANRIPLNISLVLDRSGSMAGDKIAYVKKAAQFVIDNLAAEDRLSVVQYDDVIDVLIPSGAVKNKAEAKRRVEEIQARNMTNLSGGMLAGYEQVQSTKQENYVNRVLLLSDGLANLGIQDPDQLKLIAQSRFREQGIALSTFGVGNDFNEVLMTNLSEYGGANYYFIDSPDKIPAIFAEELRGLLAVVAQNVRLEIRYPAEYFQAEKVYGFPADLQTGAVKVLFNDLFAEEKKAILLKLVAVRPLDRDVEFSAALRYDSALGDFSHVEETLTGALALTKDESLIASGVQPIVLEQTALFVANDLYEEALRHVDRRDFEGARRLIAQAKMYLEKHFQMMPATEELSRLYNEILRYEHQLKDAEGMADLEMRKMQKISYFASYSSRRKKP